MFIFRGEVNKAAFDKSGAAVLEVTKIFLLDVGADFVTKIFDYFSDLIYQKIIALLGDFFGVMNATGYDLFGMPWVRQIVQLFSNLGWALFVVGIIVALFEFAIESQNGRGDPKALALNIIKGFFAVNLFCNVPVQLYGLAVSLQSSMSADMTGLISPEGSGTLLNACLDVINGFLFGPLLGILIAVMMGYAIIKVFFASIKRGGILLIQIAIGSLYMFSVPRGFNDGFVMWVKQVIATCLTAFLQSTMLVCGLILFKDHWLLGLGIMLAAGEIPRIAGMFGLETSVRPNINGVINTAQSAVHLKQMVTTVAKK